MSYWEMWGIKVGTGAPLVYSREITAKEMSKYFAKSKVKIIKLKVIEL